MGVRLAGFTLVELLIVIILLGILSAYAVPRLLGPSAFEAYTVRDQLIGLLRLTQSSQMQDTCHHYRLQVSPAQLVIERQWRNQSRCHCEPESCDANAQQLTVIALDKIRITLGGLSQFSLDFDAMGRPADGAVFCAGFDPCLITVTGTDALPICIEPEGYIHPGSC